MGIRTPEQLKQGNVQFVSLDNDTGYLVSDHTQIGDIEGDLLGYDSHTYTPKKTGKEERKFDIYLRLEDNTIYQVSLGFYAWYNLGLLNCLSNIREDTHKGGKMRLLAFKDKEDRQVILPYWNSKYHGRERNKEALAFGEKKGDEAGAWKNKLIDRFYALITEKNQFKPEKTAIVQDSEPEVVATDKVPF